MLAKWWTPSLFPFLSSCSLWSLVYHVPSLVRVVDEASITVAEVRVLSTRFIAPPSDEHIEETPDALVIMNHQNLRRAIFSWSRIYVCGRGNAARSKEILSRPCGDHFYLANQSMPISGYISLVHRWQIP
jgi:hypothetical protein